MKEPERLEEAGVDIEFGNGSIGALFGKTNPEHSIERLRIARIERFATLLLVRKIDFFHPAVIGCIDTTHAGSFHASFTYETILYSSLIQKLKHNSQINQARPEKIAISYEE